MSHDRSVVWKKLEQVCSKLLPRVSLMLGILVVSLTAQAGDTNAQEQLKSFSDLAGKAGNASQGEVFFNQKHGRQWSCSSCHNTPPVTTGKHASTGKPIKPLAPSANSEAFTDSAKVEKWFRRNCKDVLERECTAAEKADVMAYLLGVR